MIVVIELQKMSDSQVANIVTAHQSRNEAEQRYHQVLAAAAVSTLPQHAATMLEDTGYLIKNECYTH